MPTSNEPKYFRDFSNFGKEHFLEEISHIDFTGLITDDVNKSFSNSVIILHLQTNQDTPIWPHVETPMKHWTEAFPLYFDEISNPRA